MERSPFFESAHDTGPCRKGWHLMHTVEGEPIYFRRAGRTPSYAYVLRRPPVHVHVGAPITLTGDRTTRTAQAHTAVTAAWRTAAARLGEPA